VFTVVKIHNVVWVRTLYSLVHGYEYFWRAFCSLSSQSVWRERQYGLAEKHITHQSNYMVLQPGRVQFLSFLWRREGGEEKEWYV